MITDIKDLLSKVSFLNEAQKPVYAAVFAALDEQQKAEMVAFLEETAKQESLLKSELQKEKSGAINEFLTTCQRELRNGYAKMQEVEEQANRDRADKLLNNL